jgi:hypothetical protein
MELEQLQDVYHKLAIGAVELLLRTNAVPQHLAYFFKEDNRFYESTRGQLRPGADWQRRLMLQLVGKSAVQLSGNHVIVRNRFYLQELLKEAEVAPKRLMDMACSAAEIEAPRPSSRAIPLGPVPQQSETVQRIGATGFVAERIPANDAKVEGQRAMENEDRPTAQEPKPAQDDSQVVLLLQQLQELLVKSLEIQQAIAENVIYVRDTAKERHVKLTERVKGLEGKMESIEKIVQAPVQLQDTTGINEKLTVIEQKLETNGHATGERHISEQDREAVAELIATSVNSMQSVVTEIKGEVQQIMQSTIQRSDADRLAQIKASLARISNEFTALRELTLESLSEAPS